MDLNEWDEAKILFLLLDVILKVAPEWDKLDSVEMFVLYSWSNSYLHQQFSDQDHDICKLFEKSWFLTKGHGLLVGFNVILKKVNEMLHFPKTENVNLVLNFWALSTHKQQTILCVLFKLFRDRSETGRPIGIISILYNSWL